MNETARYFLRRDGEVGELKSLSELRRETDEEVEDAKRFVAAELKSMDPKGDPQAPLPNLVNAVSRNHWVSRGTAYLAIQDLLKDRTFTSRVAKREKSGAPRTRMIKFRQPRGRRR